MLFSIIIPTKNRYETLFPVIDKLSQFVKGENLEIIVQDNSSDNSSAIDFFYNQHDSRIKYFHSNQSLSITQNTINAIKNSSGKFLTFIGDDDLVSPHIYEFVKYIDKYNIPALIYSPSYYWWESVSFEKESKYRKKRAFWLPKNINTQFYKINSKFELEKMLRSGAGYYSRLPKFYHGIVRRDKLDLINAQTGTYLPGASPDISFSTALSLVMDEYYFVNYPLTVFGASRNSGGGLTAKKKHFGKIEDQNFLPDKTKNNWNELLPRVWSERTIYAQSVLEVFEAFKKSVDFNYLYFYAISLAYEPYLFNYLKPCIKKRCAFNVLSYIKLISFYLRLKLGQLYRMFLKSRNEYELYENYELMQVMSQLNLITPIFSRSQ